MPITIPRHSRAQHRDTYIEPTTSLCITLSYDDKPAECAPFRVASSALGAVSNEEEDEMGLAYNVYLNADRIFGCKNCKTHLATHDSIISRVSSLSSLTGCHVISLVHYFSRAKKDWDLSIGLYSIGFSAQTDCLYSALLFNGRTFTTFAP